MRHLLPPLLLASALTLSGGGKPLPRHLADAPRATGCESLGAGFVKVEGSDTCVKLGGSIRAEYGINAGGFSDRR